jgi:hypothetical protein
VTVLSDDFIVRDSKGRQFSPDAAVTKKLIETTDKSIVAEVLQPSIERNCVQGFRLPEDATEGALTLVIPEKGLLKGSEAKIEFNNTPSSSDAYKFTSISDGLFQEITRRTTDGWTVPTYLKDLVVGPTQIYWSGANSFGQFREHRIWLSLEKKPDKKLLFFDLLRIHDIGTQMVVSSSLHRIREALKKAETTSKDAKGF